MVKDIFKNAVRSRKDILNLLFLPLAYSLIILAFYLFNGTEFLNRNILSIFYALMFSWSRNMIEIQVSFVTKQVFQPFNLGTLSMVIPSVIYIIFKPNFKNYFLFVAILTALVFFEYVISVLRQGAKILNIKIFSIKQNLKK